MLGLGRTIFRACCGILIGMDGLTALMNWSSGRSVLGDVIRMGLTIIWLRAVWVGFRCAKWLLILMLMGVGTLALIDGWRSNAGALISLGVTYVAIGTMFFTPPVDFLLREQQIERQRAANGKAAEE